MAGPNEPTDDSVVDFLNELHSLLQNYSDSLPDGMADDFDGEHDKLLESFFEKNPEHISALGKSMDDDVDEIQDALKTVYQYKRDLPPGVLDALDEINDSFRRIAKKRQFSRVMEESVEQRYFSDSSV